MNMYKTELNLATLFSKETADNELANHLLLSNLSTLAEEDVYLSVRDGIKLVSVLKDLVSEPQQYAREAVFVQMAKEFFKNAEKYILDEGVEEDEIRKYVKYSTAGVRLQITSPALVVEFCWMAHDNEKGLYFVKVTDGSSKLINFKKEYIPVLSVEDFQDVYDPAESVSEIAHWLEGRISLALKIAYVDYGCDCV